MRNLTHVLVVLLCIAMSHMASAQCAYQVPASISGAWQPTGQGTLHYWGFSVYDAALWVPNQQRYSSDQPFALSLCYHREFEGSDIVKQTIKELDTINAATAQQKEEMRRALTFFPTVKNGDTLTGVYDPIANTQFYFNGRLIGELTPALGALFFQIWLHENTSAPQLREQLLGRMSS
jgi:hypothetical protein